MLRAAKKGAPNEHNLIPDIQDLIMYEITKAYIHYRKTSEVRFKGIISYGNALCMVGAACVKCRSKYNGKTNIRVMLGPFLQDINCTCEKGHGKRCKRDYLITFKRILIKPCIIC